MGNRESLGSFDHEPQPKEQSEQTTEKVIDTKIIKLEEKVAAQPDPHRSPPERTFPHQAGKEIQQNPIVPKSPSLPKSRTTKQLPDKSSTTLPKQNKMGQGEPTSSPIIIKPQIPHMPRTPHPDIVITQEPLHDPKSKKFESPSPQSDNTTTTENTPTTYNHTETVSEIIVEEKSSGYGIFRRGLLADPRFGGQKQGTTETTALYRSPVSPKQKEAFNKNKDRVTASIVTTSPVLKQSLTSQERTRIEQAIITQVQQDDWYQDRIRTIRDEGTKRGLSRAAIEQQITDYNQTVVDTLLPAFLAEMEQGNIVIRNKDGQTLALSEETKQKLEQNEDFLSFKKLYEKFILDPYEDLSDSNYLERDGLATPDPLQQQMIRAIKTNPVLETFLFDNAHEKSAGYHTTTQERLLHPYTSEQYNHLAELLGYPVVEDEKEQHPETYTSYVTELLGQLNPYTYKRSKQYMMLQYCTTLSRCFGGTQLSGEKTIDLMHMDFTTMTIDSSTLQFQQPITYNQYTSTLTIDGTAATLGLPSSMDIMFGNKVGQHTLPTQTPSYQQLEQTLQEQSQLTPEEIYACHTIEEIQNRIVQKMQNAMNQLTPEPSQERIATLLEQEAFLTHRGRFFSGANQANKTPSLIFQNQKNSAALQSTLTRRVYGAEGKEPLGTEELRRCTTILTNPKVAMLFSHSYQNNIFGMENFLETIGFFEWGNRLNNNDIVLFFESVYQMATSEVQSDQETGYITLTSLIKQHTSITPQPLGTNSAGSAYLYTADHLIIPQQQFGLSA